MVCLLAVHALDSEDPELHALLWGREWIDDVKTSDLRGFLPRGARPGSGGVVDVCLGHVCKSRIAWIERDGFECYEFAVRRHPTASADFQVEPTVRLGMAAVCESVREDKVVRVPGDSAVDLRHSRRRGGGTTVHSDSG